MTENQFFKKAVKVVLSLKDRLKFATQYLSFCLKADAPYDTGNLALNSIIVENDSLIVIGGEIAPYAVVTNEKWAKGTNPNEGWVERSIERAIPGMRNIFFGTYSKDDIDAELMKEGATLLETRQRRREEINRGGK